MFNPRYPEQWDKLTKEEKQTLLGEGNNLYTIGGRSTDVMQLASSVAYEVKNHYPANKVPLAQIDSIIELDRLAMQFETVLCRVINDLARYTIAHRQAVR